MVKRESLQLLIKFLNQRLFKRIIEHLIKGISRVLSARDQQDIDVYALLWIVER